MSKGNSITHTHYGIYIYALLLLSYIKWEVAYSTLCTEIFRKLYINLHIAGLLFSKLDLWQSHMVHTHLHKRTSIRLGEL